VTVRVSGRAVALAVEQVIGIRPIDAESLGALPPLLQMTAPDAVEAIGVLDGELLLLLETARVVPDALLDQLPASPGGSPA
jgi:purine-binding chemotaxis protein CheW